MPFVIDKFKSKNAASVSEEYVQYFPWLTLFILKKDKKLVDEQS